MDSRDSSGRIIQMLHLREKNSKETFWVMNTHLQGGGKSEQQSEVNILSLIGRVKQHHSHVIVCGDLNLTPQDILAQKLVRNGLNDVLKNCNGATSFHMSGTARLDFVLSTVNPSKAFVSGKMNDLMTREEPSDHLIVGAEFYIPNIKTNAFSGLQTKNPQTAPFRAHIFNVFNKEMQSGGFDQTTYDRWMPLFNDALNTADLRTKQQRGDFVAFAKEEILKRFAKKEEALFLLDAMDLAANKLEEPMFVGNCMQDYYHNYLISKFNSAFAQDFGHRKYLYDKFLNTFQTALINAHNQANYPLGGSFLEYLRKEVANLSSFRIEKEFLDEIVEAEIITNFIEVRDSFKGKNNTQPAILGFLNDIPLSEQGSVFGYTYHIEKDANRKTDHWDFGRVAFLQQEGRDVTDETRIAAIERHLLEKVAPNILIKEKSKKV
jgi:hypothetical protein